MPSHYVHLANGDLRDRVLRDAGLDGLGRPQMIEAGDDANALAAILSRLVASQGK